MSGNGKNVPGGKNGRGGNQGRSAGGGQKHGGQTGSGGDEFLFYTAVDDEHYGELQTLLGQKLVFGAVWEDSLADALEERSGEQPPRPPQPAPAAEDAADADDEDEALDEGGPTCDMDLYLEDGVYFELYSVAAYESLDGEPLPTRTAIEAALYKLLAGRASLGDVAVDEDDSLVLVLHSGPKPALYLAVGGWVLEEWDELPV